ncbi:transporter substrate-binding domain-containing protein, partial [Candidatus Saccharibacteria bacterium]|nr:transporter substrate-binding domain-containing protein [Candidatus Saccharibacteria bacterium]NIV71951.1 transporter substrate-binding domain-containing protein [Calditrichia bacterium]NIW79499.1 transporter substrate-binding domain-containing protein [Calditrichia bacterium]
SSFTAAITSSLTVNQLQSNIRGPEDLPGVRVATVSSSTSEAYLQEERISYVGYDAPLDALQSLANGERDAVVYDAPILRYLVNKQFKGKIQVLSSTFSRQDYGIAFPAGSSLREPINQTMLKKIREPEWRKVLHRYLGEN